MHKLHKFHKPDETSFIDDEAESYKKNWRNMLGVFRYNSIVLVSEKVVDCKMNENTQNLEKEKCILPFTGERFVPDISEKYIVAEHYQRYNAVLNIVKGKKVLDAACGAGYGTALMASVAENVTGIDISSEAISYANTRYSDVGNARYLEASIAELPFSDNSFDVIISFETIEHVNEELQNKFLKEIKRCLKDDGILVMSSPDKRTYTDLPGYHNEFHVKEFYFDEFDAFLRREFKYVEHYLQGEHDLSGEMLYPVKNDTFSLRVLNRLDTDKDKDRYIVSVCSNNRLKREVEISSWFSYEYVPTVYPYIDGLYKSENVVSPSSFEHNNTYKVRFDLTNIHTDGRVQFIPLETACCEIELLKIDSDIIDYAVVSFNAIRSCGHKYIFITTAPGIEIFGDFSQASYLEISYSLKILAAREISMYAHEVFASYDERIKALEDEISAIKSTKGYKALEKFRHVRKTIF